MALRRCAQCKELRDGNVFVGELCKQCDEKGTRETEEAIVKYTNKVEATMVKEPVSEDRLAVLGKRVKRFFKR